MSELRVKRDPEGTRRRILEAATEQFTKLVGMGYYVVSNRFTLEAFTGRNYAEQRRQESISAMHADMLLSYLRPVSPAVE